MREWVWTKPREKAALLVAEDKLPDVEIAAQCRIVERTLDRWKRTPEFRARVEEHVGRYRERIRNRGIAVLENRVEALQARWEGMRQVIAARAGDPRLAGAPGGDTGLLTRQVRLVKTYGSDEEEPPEGEDGETLHSLKQMVVVEEFALDTGLLKELREHERQAAQELGQWMERRQVELYDDRAGQSLSEKLDALATRLGEDAGESAEGGAGGVSPEPES